MTSVAIALSSLGPYTGLRSPHDIGLLSLYPPEVGCVVAAPAFEVMEPVAILTNVSLAYAARAQAEGLAYRVVSFQAGASGYNPSEFTQPTPLAGDDGIMALRYEGPVTRIEPATTDETLWSYGCTVPEDVVAVLGEFALISEIVYSPLNPAEVGTRFVYAVAHTPAISKHAKKALTIRLLVRGG